MYVNRLGDGSAHLSGDDISPVHTSNKSKQHCRMLQVERFFRQRTKFYDKLVRHSCSFWQTKSNFASTLLLVWTGL